MFDENYNPTDPRSLTNLKENTDGENYTKIT